MNQTYAGIPATKTEIEVGGRTLTVETGRVAQQASGAVTVRVTWSAWIDPFVSHGIV